MKKDSLSERIYNRCWRDLLETGNIAPFAGTLQDWAMQGVNAWNPPLMRYESLKILSLFRNDTTREALRSLVKHGDTLDVFAARTLIQWGDWDTAAPLLEKRGMYADLAQDMRALPLLYRTLKSEDLTRRLTAADALYTKLEKPDSVHAVAREVLKLPSSRRGPVATKMAVDYLSHNPSRADLATLTEVVVTDTSHWSQLGAFGALVTIAFTGDSTALAQLDSISRQCTDPQIRDRAAGYIKAAKRSARAGAVLDSSDTSTKKKP